MKREILRGFTMLLLIVTLAFMTAVASANGQSHAVVANIPFEFSVGNKALPAGEYTVSAFKQDDKVLTIKNRRANDAAIRLTNSIQASKAPEKARLVFHRYGPRYFLSEVWTSGETTGRQLLKSKEERTIESQLAALFPKNELAQNYEIVEIVATVH